MFGYDNAGLFTIFLYIQHGLELDLHRQMFFYYLTQVLAENLAFCCYDVD
jgi:hypothetical protein